jgi:hypothetical protein
MNCPQHDFGIIRDMKLSRVDLLVVCDASICSLTAGAEQPNLVLVMADDVSP